MQTNRYKLPVSLQAYIAQEILPQYTHFDKAHGVDHVQTVIEESMRLAAYYEVDCSMVYTIAAYHDLGLWKGREFHHVVSGEMLMNDSQLREWFTETQLRQMQEAIEDHRASNQQAPRSIYGKIVAEADRIIDPDITLRRTVQYGLSHYPELEKAAQYARFRQHLSDKYAEGGYLKLWIPQSDNARQLQELRRIMNDPELLYCQFEKIYADERAKTNV